MPVVASLVLFLLVVCYVLRVDVCWLLFVVCRALFNVCCLLCGVLFVVKCLLLAMFGCSWFVVCCLSCVACRGSCFVNRLSFVVRCALCVVR